MVSGRGENNNEEEIKAVFLGDSNAGKTNLISTYLHGIPPDDRRATLFENYYKDITYKRRNYRFFICDVGGHADLNRLERMSYLDTNAFIICVDISNEKGLEGAERWVDELRDAGAQIFLCFTKTDLEHKIDDEAIEEFMGSHENIVSVSKTSCRDQKSIKIFFNHVIESVLSRTSREESSCWSSCFRCYK